MTDADGNMLERYNYEPYGRLTITDASYTPRAATLYDNTLTFQGRRWDAESSLYYFRNRMYSAELGRFVQRDPAGYVDGMNLRSLEQGAPVWHLDPSGLDFQSGGKSFTAYGPEGYYPEAKVPAQWKDEGEVELKKAWHFDRERAAWNHFVTYNTTATVSFSAKVEVGQTIQVWYTVGVASASVSLTVTQTAQVRIEKSMSDSVPIESLQYWSREYGVYERHISAPCNNKGCPDCPPGFTHLRFVPGGWPWNCTTLYCKSDPYARYLSKEGYYTIEGVSEFRREGGIQTYKKAEDIYSEVSHNLDIAITGIIKHSFAMQQ